MRTSKKPQSYLAVLSGSMNPIPQSQPAAADGSRGKSCVRRTRCKRGMITEMKQKVETVSVGAAQTPAPRLSPFVRNFRRDWQLHLLILLPMIWLLIFHYGPMYGAQIAFRNYKPRTGIWGSEWVGLKWFKRFLSSPDFGQIFLNTLLVSLYTLAMFPIPIIMALLINVIPHNGIKKTVQTISYMPHFISIVILVAILNQILSPVNGLYGVFYRMFGGEGYPADIRASADAFRHLYVWSGVWQNCGWNTIIYLSALSSVSSELHEAAEIDGATRLKRVRHIDLPTILPTVGIMLILRCGHVISVGFEKTHLMQNSLNISKSEVISTYVYKKGLGNSNQFSFGSAVSLFNSLVNCILMLTVNWISKKASDDEVSLF